jgi:hypothetical protein
VSTASTAGASTGASTAGASTGASACLQDATANAATKNTKRTFFMLFKIYLFDIMTQRYFKSIIPITTVYQTCIKYFVNGNIDGFQQMKILSINRFYLLYFHKTEFSHI